MKSIREKRKKEILKERRSRMEIFKDDYLLG